MRCLKQVVYLSTTHTFMLCLGFDFFSYKMSFLKFLSSENKLLNFRHIGQNTNNLVEFLEKHENILIEAGKDEEPEIET